MAGTRSAPTRRRTSRYIRTIRARTWHGQERQATSNVPQTNSVTSYKQPGAPYSRKNRQTRKRQKGVGPKDCRLQGEIELK